MSRLTSPDAQRPAPGADTQLRLALLGLRVIVESDDQDLMRSSRDLWSRCLDRPATTPSDLVITTLPGDTDTRLAARIIGKVTEASAAKWLTLGASAVADQHGEVVAFLSTDSSARCDAVQQLASQGFGYVAGSLLAVDADGVVTPFPGPLPAARAADEDEDGDRSSRSPDGLGLPHCANRLRLARLVVLDRRPDVAEPKLVREDLLQTLQAITPLITPAAANELPLRRLCKAIGLAGGVYRLSYAQIGQAAELLGDLLASAPQDEPEPCEPLAVPRVPLDSVGWRVMDGRIHRAPYRDAIRIGSEGLVSSESVPTRLGPLGLTIWELAADAPTVDELIVSVVERHGPHPEAETLVTEAVASMLEAHVLGYHRPRRLDEVLLAFGPSGHEEATAEA
jgi:hypothetical protein